LKKTLFIGLVGLFMTACSTVDVPPIDDAYIWQETTKSVSTSPSESVSSEVSTKPTVSKPDSTIKPGMHILYEKDTTITVRII
jgi:hypothetical protein